MSIAVLICDGAGWHQPGGELVVPDNIVLLPLPPYAPELNPMENVWDYLRGNKLCAARLGQLRRHRRSLPEGLELPRRRPRPHPFHRHPRLGNGQCLGRLV